MHSTQISEAGAAWWCGPLGRVLTALQSLLIPAFGTGFVSFGFRGFSLAN